MFEPAPEEESENEEEHGVWIFHQKLLKIEGGTLRFVYSDSKKLYTNKRFFLPRCPYSYLFIQVTVMQAAVACYANKVRG